MEQLFIMVGVLWRKQYNRSLPMRSRDCQTTRRGVLADDWEVEGGEMIERPTPETDEVQVRQEGLLCGAVNLNFARKLERERDEARRGIRLMAQNAELWKEKAEKLERELQVTLEGIQITNDNSYIPGKDCQCEARNESECGCDADWTPKEVYRLRAENDKLQATIAQLQDRLDNELAEWKECADALYSAAEIGLEYGPSAYADDCYKAVKLYDEVKKFYAAKE